MLRVGVVGVGGMGQAHAKALQKVEGAAFAAVGDRRAEAGEAVSERGQRERPSSWYGTLGGLLENGIHKVDLLNWFGGEPRSVTAEVGSFSGREDWEDYAVYLMRYDSGVFGTMRWGPFMGARGNN